MSPSAEIRRRIKREDGTWTWSARGKGAEVRWVCYYRAGGRGAKLYGGTFRRKADAEARERLILRELAEGRDPKLAFRPHVDSTPTFEAAAARWYATRIDLAPATRRSYSAGRDAAVDYFGARLVGELDHMDAQAFVVHLAETYEPATVRTYVVAARLILDHAIDPEHNPFRDKRVSLPRITSEQINPPTWAQVEAVLERTTSRQVRLAIILMERTAMRVGETCALTWGDFDLGRLIIRPQGATTKAGKPRLVTIDADLAEAVDAFTPREDRTATDRIVGISTKSVSKAIERALRFGAAAHWTPHDLRHRRISLRIGRGDNPVLVAAEVGHRNPEITWRIYSHVLMDMTDPPTAELVGYLSQPPRGVSGVYGKDESGTSAG